MEHVICYISTATVDLAPHEIQSLMEKWQEHNSSIDIKGILLFSDGHFFQVLEGEKERVLELYFKISNDERHKDLIQVVGKDVEKGSLDGYLIDNLSNQRYSKPELIRNYLESVKGMAPEVQRQIRVILNSFMDTRVL